MFVLKYAIGYALVAWFLVLFSMALFAQQLNQ